MAESIDELCKPTVVLTYGTFDLFHIGHLNLLKRAGGLGDKLVVYVSTDKFNGEKGKTACVRFPERLEIVSRCSLVGEAHGETSFAQKTEDVEYWESLGYKVILVMGDDWRGKFDGLPCDVVYLPKTEGVSSSIIKGRIRNGC